MTTYTKKQLGQAVSDLRKSQGKTQEELGRKAGYGAGAGVSISRLEHGLLMPLDDQLEGIARELGLTRPELEARAREEVVVEDAPASAAPGATSGGAPAPPSQKELNAREDALKHEIGERTRIIATMGEAYNTQHDRACDQFSKRFVEIAKRLEGAPPLELQDGDSTLADRAISYQLKSSNAAGAQSFSPTWAVKAGAGAGRAAGVAAAGAAGASGAAGVAAVALSTILLTGIIGGPLVLLLGGGYVGMRKRSRKQREEYAAQLDEAEAQLEATRPGIEAFVEALARATETLDYIATHGGHALARWEDQLGAGMTTWDSLDSARQERYLGFIDVVSAQNRIVTFDFKGLLIAGADELGPLIELVDDVLTQSLDAVKAHV